MEKEAVPVERVRLDNETVTEQETVTEEVRKEQIETDGDGHRRPPLSEHGDRRWSPAPCVRTVARQ